MILQNLLVNWESYADLNLLKEAMSLSFIVTLNGQKTYLYGGVLHETLKKMERFYGAFD